jgi:1-acyl-sn-glycerol-3-phosphate acyltransferase
MTDSPNKAGKHTLCSLLCRLYLKLIGWRIEGEKPTARKFVLVFAHHTSNFDILIYLPMLYALGYTQINWLGKEAIFKAPVVGAIARWFGGIPVNRKLSQDIVEQAVREIERREEIILGITPEGTRRHRDYWKSGFYHIAQGAGVPIVLGHLDYSRKAGGVGPLIEPSGDIEADVATIRAFFGGVVGRFPAEQGEVRLSVPRTPAGAVGRLAHLAETRVVHRQVSSHSAVGSSRRSSSSETPAIA